MVDGESVSVLLDTGWTAILVAGKFIKGHNQTRGVREVTLANGCLKNVRKCGLKLTLRKSKVRQQLPFANLIVGNYTREDILVKKESSSVDKEDEKWPAVDTRF